MELLSDGSPDESNDPAWLEAAMTKIRKIFGEDRIQDSLPFSPISPTSPSDNILLHREQQHPPYHQQPLFSDDKKRRRMHSHDDGEEDCVNGRRPQHSRQLSIASILNPEPGQSRNRDQDQQSGTAAVSGFVPGEGGAGGNLYSAGYLKEERMATATLTRRSSHDLVWQGQQHRNSAQYTETSSREPASRPPSTAGSYSIATVERSPVHPLSDGEGSGDRYDPAHSYLSERHAFWPCYFKLILEENRLNNTYPLPLVGWESYR
ncbi:hypothetical protein EDD21DRAFT_122632 [Dissophora ornata]|nr:hypothetical protein EDD21DRAFT_122632 [Dissophora ornata]